MSDVKVAQVDHLRMKSLDLSKMLAVNREELRAEDDLAAVSTDYRHRGLAW